MVNLDAFRLLKLLQRTSRVRHLDLLHGQRIPEIPIAEAKHSDDDFQSGRVEVSTPQVTYSVWPVGLVYVSNSKHPLPTVCIVNSTIKAKSLTFFLEGTNGY